MFGRARCEAADRAAQLAVRQALAMPGTGELAQQVGRAIDDDEQFAGSATDVARWGKITASSACRK